MKAIKHLGRTFKPLFPDLLRPLTDEEREDLQLAIQRTGRVEVAVLVDESDGIIDGINRMKLAAELDITDVKLDVRMGLSDSEKRDLALMVNNSRRHLAPAERRQQVAESLKAEPEKSNRQHAKKVGVDHKTVAAVRGEMESTGEIPQLETTTGKDNKQRPAKQPRKAEPPPEEDEAPEPRGEVLTDEADQEIPERAAPAFRELPTLRKLLKTLDDTAREIERVAKEPHGLLFHCHWQSAQGHVKDARRTLHQGRPSHVCPYCKGLKDECQGCRGRGFVSVRIYDAAPPEMKPEAKKGGAK